MEKSAGNFKSNLGVPKRSCMGHGRHMGGCGLKRICEEQSRGAVWVREGVHGAAQIGARGWWWHGSEGVCKGFFLSVPASLCPWFCSNHNLNPEQSLLLLPLSFPKSDTEIFCSVSSEFCFYLLKKNKSIEQLK